jgi:hypothetical protein
VTFNTEDSSNAKSTCVLEAVQIEIQAVILETIKTKVLSVSKSIA